MCVYCFLVVVLMGIYCEFSCFLLLAFVQLEHFRTESSLLAGSIALPKEFCLLGHVYISFYTY